MKAKNALSKTPLHILICLLGLLAAPPLWAAQIQVTVDRNPVNLSDSFQIVFTATEEPDDDPDFSPLEQDFSILHQNHGSSSSWVNGQTSKIFQWTVNVMAKTTGNLTVPAIHFGDDVTSPLALQVLQDPQQGNANTHGELFLKAEATPSSAYVQAQILYTLRVYTRVDIARAQLSEPELADAVIEKLGEDANYNTQINGVDYSVTERKYAVFPQKSGPLTIKPLVLTADVLSAGRSVYNNFFSPPVAKSTRVESPAVKLDIRPAPATADGQHWLPAGQVELKQTWSGDIAHLKVGEPLTRTLTLQAKGVTVGQLPELAANTNSDAFKSYPDQPVLKEHKSPDGLAAFREEKIALIPSQAGSYTLPAISIPWFNTQTQKMEMAVIAETILTATASQAPAPLPTPTPVPESTTLQAPASPINVASLTPADDFWAWLSLVLGVGWLATLVYFFRPARSRKAAPNAVADTREIRFKDTVNALKKACQDNDAVAAKNTLLAWGQQQFQANSLGAVAAHCEARLRDEIVALNQILYGKAAGQWQGKRLFQTFTENQARAKLAAKEDNVLEPLYRL